jgi:hypothetical protein
VYAATIAELGPALRLIRAVEITGGGKVSKATLPSACGCGLVKPDPVPYLARQAAT